MPRERSPSLVPDAATSAILTAPARPQRLDLGAIFGREAPLVVDIGCGKGRFLLAQASQHPGRNYLGIDRLRVRMQKLDRRTVESGLKNVRLLNAEAALAVRDLLPPGSVIECFVFFPDPWPKRKHHRRRLLGPDFMCDLHRALAPHARLHVATDHADYFAAIHKLLAADTQLRELTPPFAPAAEERTEFESIFLAQGLTIGRCSFEKRA